MSKAGNLKLNFNDQWSIKTNFQQLIKINWRSVWLALKSYLIIGYMHFYTERQQDTGRCLLDLKPDREITFRDDVFVSLCKKNENEK